MCDQLYQNICAKDLGSIPSCSRWKTWNYAWHTFSLIFNSIKEPCQVSLHSGPRVRPLLTSSCNAPTLTQTQIIPVLDHCKSFPCLPLALLPSILNRAAKVLQLKTEVGSHLLSAQSPPLISSLFQHKSHRPHDGLLYPSPTPTSLISYPISLPIAYSAPATLASLLLRQHTSAFVLLFQRQSVPSTVPLGLA